MSKFILPTQKGLELFPNAVVAPPIVRWVGVDARSAEAQAVLAQHGSALTAFHAQQAHNHSLSGNTQSRGARQISPNLAVTYVNQGGIEYITLHVKPVSGQIERAATSEQARTSEPDTPRAVPCWYPTAYGGQLISETLGIASIETIRAEMVGSYPKMDPAPPFGDSPYRPDVDMGFEINYLGQSVRFLDVSGGYIGFRTPTAYDKYGADIGLFYGASWPGDSFNQLNFDPFTYVGPSGFTRQLTSSTAITNSQHALYDWSSTSNPDVDNYRLPSYIALLKSEAFTYMHHRTKGAKDFGGGQTRKYYVETWVDLQARKSYNTLFDLTYPWMQWSELFVTPDLTGPSTMQLTIIERTDKCPALIGLSYLGVSGYAPYRDTPVNPPYDASSIDAFDAMFWSNWTADPYNPDPDDFARYYYPAPYAGFAYDTGPGPVPRWRSAGHMTGSQTSNIAPHLSNQQFWFVLDAAGVPRPTLPGLWLPPY